MRATFFAGPAESVARSLLGTVLVSTVGGRLTAGRIVETEAYVGPHDPASHAAERIGRTRRNDAMFGAPGTAYVYRIYGLHWCLNVVTGVVDDPAAVLIRAIEPVAGEAVMRERREWRGRRLEGRSLSGGPARLAEALGVTGALDAHALDAPPLSLHAGQGGAAEEPVSVGPRIGVTRAVDWPLRFWLSGNPWVSR